MADQTETTYTPGPWRWELKPRTKEASLVGGRPRFDLVVMDFARWGMNGAKPRFLTPLSSSMSMILEDAEKFATPIAGREHHEWIRTLNHPDANVDRWALVDGDDRRSVEQARQVLSQVQS